MRIAAWTVVVVLAIPLESRAQAPNAHGKSDFGHQQWQNGQGKRIAFAAQDFKIGLSSPSDAAPAPAPSTSRGGHAETPVVQIEWPQSPPPTSGKAQIPDCVVR